MDLSAQVTKVLRIFRFYMWFDLDCLFISLPFFQLCLPQCVTFVLMPAFLLVTTGGSLSPDVGN